MTQKSFDRLDLNSCIYPLPFLNYFLIVIDSGNSNYNFYNEIIANIKNELNSKGTHILVVDNLGKFSNQSAYVIRNVTWPSIVYLCRNSVATLSFSKSVLEISNKPVDPSSIKSAKFNDFAHGHNDQKNPSDISRLIVNDCQNLIYYGINSRTNVIEYIPNCPPDQTFGNNVILRLDKFNDIKMAERFGRKYSGVIFDKYSPDIRPLLSNSVKKYMFVDDVNLDKIIDIIDNNWNFLCKDKTLLASKRCEYIDYKVFQFDDSKRGMLSTFDLKDCYCESGRRIFSKSAFYNSYSHENLGLTFSEQYGIIDDNTFWEGQDFLRIYAKH
jgi:hypothetical protein